MRVFVTIVDLIVSAAFCALGTYLLMHAHPAAGGWTLFFGLLCGAFATHGAIAGLKDDGNWWYKK